MAETITGETKREGQRKAKRRTTYRTQNRCRTQNRRRKQIPLVVGSYFIHGSSNVACMQIMITNSKEGLEQASPANAIFLFITEAKTH